jgi:hypothetical protein
MTCLAQRASIAIAHSEGAAHILPSHFLRAPKCVASG